MNMHMEQERFGLAPFLQYTDPVFSATMDNHLGRLFLILSETSIWGATFTGPSR